MREKNLFLYIHCKYIKVLLNFKIFSAVTADGEPCHVPFKYAADGTELYKCTTAGTNKGEWCATTVESDLTYDDWEWC